MWWGDEVVIQNSSLTSALNDANLQMNPYKAVHTLWVDTYYTEYITYKAKLHQAMWYQ